MSSKEHIYRETLRLFLKSGYEAVSLADIEKACGVCTPEQLLLSHTSIVYYELGSSPMMIFSSTDVCLTSLQGRKICYNNILEQRHHNAICVTHELEPDGRLKSWKEFSPKEIVERGVLVGKQDIRQSKKYILKHWVDHIKEALSKHNVKAEDVYNVIPRVSSIFLYEKLNDEIAYRNMTLTKEKWFTDLTSVGNIGSVTKHIALEKLLRTKKVWGMPYFSRYNY